MPIICYHSVDPGWESPLAVRPEDFDAHCAWLARHRTLLPAREHAELVARGARRRRLASLTFDDGFADFHDQAFPVLRRRRLPATMFLVARTLEESDGRADWLRPQPAVGPRVLTREQVLEMHEDGIEFGSHSWAHHDLRTLTEAECVRDLRDSRLALEDLLRRPVPLLAYPYGFHAPHVRRAARAAGYEFALSLPESHEETDDYAVPRVGIYRDNSRLAFRVKVMDGYLGVRTGPVARLLHAARSR